MPVSSTHRASELRTDSLGERLASTLRDRIVRGDIPPGTHLVEDAIAEEYGVSRGPVRDALRLLRLDQLVEPQRRGVHVIGLDETEVRNLYSVRRAIEALAVTEAIVAIEKSPHETLDEGVRGMSESVAPGLVSDFASYDLRFHRGIYEASGNRRLLGIWEQVEPLFASMLAVTNQVDNDLTNAAEDHRRLYEAIIDRDSDRALKILEEHLDGSEWRMLKALLRVRAHRPDAPQPLG